MNSSEISYLTMSVKTAISSVLLHGVDNVEYTSTAYAGMCVPKLEYLLDDLSNQVVIQATMKLSGRRKEYRIARIQIQTKQNDVMKVFETLETMILSIKDYYGASDHQIAEAVAVSVLSFNSSMQKQ